MIDKTPLKHIRYRACPDPVTVCFGHRIITAVKTLIHLFDRCDRNVLRKEFIQILINFFHREMLIHVKIRHLSGSMHPGIRSS